MPLDSPLPVGWQARLALAFERRGPRTVLARREHDGPLVVQKALHPEGPAVCHAIVVHPPAGLVGGDRLALTADVGAGGHALLTTPGATKWYRSTGAAASQAIEFRVGSGASLEWLPQESIAFDGAIAETSWRVELAADARFVAWDVHCLGRVGSGEAFSRGRYALASQVVREGRLQWIERGSIAAGDASQRSPAGLGGHAVFGTMVIAAPEIPAQWLALAREHSAASGEGAATRLPGLLLLRYRGDSTEDARAYFTAAWLALRERVLGRAAVLPRIWRT